MAKERLQKVMASAGVASRRQCEELILQGLVRVDGQVVDELPAFVDPDVSVVKVEGKRLRQPARVYFLLNKPKGIICTSSDPRGRAKAVDLGAVTRPRVEGDSRNQLRRAGSRTGPCLSMGQSERAGPCCARSH